MNLLHPTITAEPSGDAPRLPAASNSRPRVSRRVWVKNLVSSTLCLAMAAGAFPASALSPAATSWDASGEFNDQQPSGPVWSYGYIPAGGTTFVPFTTPTGVAQCMIGGVGSIPLVAHNPQMTPCTTSVTLAPRALAMHPGWNGETAVVQFKAPYAAQFRISGQFHGNDSNGQQTHTSVSVVANNSLVLYSGSIALPAQVQASFTSMLVMLQANQTLQFRVKAAPGYTAQNATTALHALIQKAGPWCGMTNPPDQSSSTC